MTNYLRSIKENNNKMELTNTGMSTGNLADSNYIEPARKRYQKLESAYNTLFQCLKVILNLRETLFSIQYIMCCFCLFSIHSSKFWSPNTPSIYDKRDQNVS